MKNIIFIDFCGQNPLGSTNHPHYRSFISPEYAPEGYNFSSKQQENQNFYKIAQQFIDELYEIGLTSEEIEKFWNTRKPGMRFIPEDAKLCFMPTIAEFITDRPWFINIEDWTTLFTPGLNCPTHNLDIENQYWFKAMRYMFNKPNCKAITTHMQSTIKGLNYLFRGYPELQKKIVHMPMAYPNISEKFTRSRKVDKDNIVFLLTNSYGGCHRNLEMRGGIESLYAFKKMVENGYNVNLIVTGQINLDGYPDLKEFYNTSQNAYFHNQFMSDEQYFRLMHEEIDVFLIPSMRIHNCSLMSSMKMGVPAIFSDGWGFSEYVTDEVNGLVAKGQWGLTSYIDENGLFRDNYTACRINQTLIDSIEEKMIKIINESELLDFIGKNALEYAKQNFDPYSRRNKFKNFLDTIYEE